MDSKLETLPDSADRVVVSVNPKAGRRSAGDRAERLARLLSDRGFGVDVFTDLDEVARTANEYHRQQRLRALVGIGGDGTAAELTNRTEPGVPLTLMAAGTANLLSKHFRLSGKPERVCETIAAGNTILIDAGRANGRMFLVMLGCGFDAEVVRQVHAHREQAIRSGGHIGYLSYIKPILRSIRSYHYPEIRVYCDPEGDGSAEEDGSSLTGRWAFAFNLPRYGWGVPLAPDATGQDGMLDVCTFARGSLLSGLKYVTAAQLGGQHRRLADCHLGKVRRVRFTADEPMAYQLDGDPGGMLPVEAEILPGRVTLVVSRREAARCAMKGRNSCRKTQ